MKAQYFRTKLTIIFVAFTIVTILSTSYFTYWQTIKLQKNELRKKLILVAKSAAALIDGDAHKQIPPQKSSSNMPELISVNSKLLLIKQLNPEIRYCYTLVKTKTPGILKFVGDGEVPFAPPGEEYKVSWAPKMEEAFIGPTADINYTKDRWGTWFSGYAPIYDAIGKPVAILGVDVAATTIASMEFLILNRVLWIMLFGTIISFILASLLSRAICRPIENLRKGMQKIVLGNIDFEIKVESKDEIGELAGSFNKMTKALGESYIQLKAQFFNAVSALALALEAKDPFSKGHSERVTNYAVSIAEELGLSKDEIEVLIKIGPIHDLGKIGIQESILQKPTKLSQEEWHIIKTHPVIGEDIIKPLGLSDVERAIIRHHHERADGKGYPDGLSGSEIEKLTSIIIVADSYDAMTSKRPYKEPMSADDAIAELKRNSGTQFSPQVVDAFIKILEQGQAGQPGKENA